MNESKSELKWFAGIWFVFFSVNSLGSCIIAGLTGAKWGVITTQERLLIGIAIAVNWTGTMGAFMSKAIARIKEGKNPMDTNGGDTKPPFKPEAKA